jgi:hypothetical protein
MPVRGDLGGLAAAGADTDDNGATATESVAACICRGLRRQYAIGAVPSCGGPERGPSSQPSALPSESSPRRRGKCSISDIAAAALGCTGYERIVTTKMSIKAKARTFVRAFGESGGSACPGPPAWAAYSSSSGCSSGGARPSRPLSSSSSVIRSTATSVSSASTLAPADPIKGTVSGSGSSTSTNFCKE